MNIFKSFTFWVLLFSGLFMFVQWIPYTGVILMMMQAHVFAGLIPHFVAIALFLDLLIKRAPKALLIIPILPYCVYFYYYSAEQETIKSIEASIRSENPSHIISYNFDEYALISSHMVTVYKIPVTYGINNNFPEGYMSHRLATQELCQKAVDNKEWKRAWPVNWYRYGRNGFTKRFTNLCRFEMPETTNKPLLRVIEKEDKTKGEKLKKTVYSFSLDDKPLGEYTAATYAALPAFPTFFIGCWLNSGAPSWDCFFRIARKKRVLDVFPTDSSFDAKDSSVVARLLGIEKYSEEELRNFTDYPETKEILSTIAEKKANETPADFDEWGLRKDGPYQPVVTTKNGVPSFTGKIFTHDKGGPFYRFIKENEGGVVYIKISTSPNINKMDHYIRNYGVCGITRKNCSVRTIDYYHFRNADGSELKVQKNGVYEGYFLIKYQLTKSRDSDPNAYVTYTDLYQELAP